MLRLCRLHERKEQSTAVTHSRKVLGQTGESIAATYLESIGFHIEGRNVRLPAGKLDIVAWDNGILVFVEVRSRRSGDPSEALASVDARKARRLMKLAQLYLLQEGLPHIPCRFDVVGITWVLGEDTPRIHHVKNAITAMS